MLEVYILIFKGGYSMKEIFIKDLRKDQEVVEFFMVKACAVKTGSNGKQYLDITLGDKTGELTGKKWDVSDGEYPALVEIKEKDIVKIRVLLQNGQASFSSVYSGFAWPMSRTGCRCRIL